MKQTLLFLGLLAAGLAVLAFLLGTEDLIQDYEKPEIEPGAVRLMDESLVDVKSTGPQARFGLPSSLEGPFTERRRVRDPDTGEVRQVLTSWLVLPTVSRFESGLFSENPKLDLFREDGTVALRLRGDLGTLYATAVPGNAVATLDSWNANSFHVTGNVVVDWMDETGETVEMQILTESLLIPGPDPEGGGWDTVECPEPLTLRRPDGSMSLQASRGRLEPEERLAVLSGPVHLEATGLGLLAADPGAATPEPLILDGDGELIYRWEERERKDASPVIRMRGGTLTLARNVRARQGDRWVHGEHLEVRLGPGGKGKSGLEVRRLVMTEPGPLPVRFGLFSGEGSAESVTLVAQNREELLLQGPVLLEHVSLERDGRPPLDLDSLSAADSAVLRVRPAADPVDPSDEENAPRLLDLTLRGNAILTAPDLADAHADVMLLTLRQEPGTRSDKTTLEELTLDGHAVLGLPERSGMTVSGTADHVSVRPAEGGGQRVQLDGSPARLDLLGAASERVRAGFLEGPSLVVVIPEDEDAQPTVDLETFLRAEFELDADTVGALAKGTEQTTQRVRIEPRGTCRLDANEDVISLVGPLHLRLPRSEGQEATLDCDEFRIEDLQSDQPLAKALHRVHLVDPEQGLDLTCRSLELGEQWVAAGPDTTAVQETTDGPRLELVGDTLTYSPDTGAMTVSREGGLARVEGPEELLDAILPAPEDDSVERGLVALEAPYLELQPREATGSDRTLGRLIALGGTTVTRARDQALIEAFDVDVDLVKMNARLEGTDAVPLLLSQPVEGLAGRSDEVRARWAELREEGGILELAPGAVFQFHRRESGRRIELRCDGPTILEGSKLRSDEGVFLSLAGSDAALTARSDHLIVVLDAAFLDGGRPLELVARKNVTWAHPTLTGTAALLAFHLKDLTADIRADTRPCKVSFTAQTLPFPLSAEFRRIQATVLLDQPGLPLEHLVMEYGRVQPGDVVRAPDTSAAPQR